MALSGTLKDFGIADILQLIGQQTKTGALRLQNGNEEVEITFVEGNVVFATEKRRDKANLLGNILLRAEMISPEQLEEALRQQQRSLKRLGDILVDQAILSEPQLSQLARLQATETLYRLFNWKSGTYEFTQQLVDLGKPAFEPLRAESILLEGFRRMDEWGPLRKRLPSNAGTFERVKDLNVADEDPGATDVGLAPLDAGGDADSPGGRHKLCYRLAAPGRPADRIIDLSRLGEFETLKTLEQLVQWGFLKYLPPLKDAQGTGTAPARGKAAKGALLQGAVSAAFLLAALLLVRLLVPAFAREREHEGPVRSGAATRVVAHGQLQRLEGALEVYRLEHGEYPEQLAQLVEGQLVTESDVRYPYRAAWHYRRTPQGFVLLPPLD